MGFFSAWRTEAYFAPPKKTKAVLCKWYVSFAAFKATAASSERKRRDMAPRESGPQTVKLVEGGGENPWVEGVGKAWLANTCYIYMIHVYQSLCMIKTNYIDH